MGRREGCFESEREIYNCRQINLGNEEKGYANKINVEQVGRESNCKLYRPGFPAEWRGGGVVKLNRPGVKVSQVFRETKGR